jgi:serine carboxypeptidase-like clade 2
MPLDNLGALNTYQDRAMVSKVDVEAVKQHCNLSYVGPLHKKRDGSCNEKINKAMESFEYVDIYDIYVDVCPTGSGLKLKMLRQMAKVSWFHAKILDGVEKRLEKQRRNWPLPPFDKCADDHLAAYLNDIDVQKAIGAIEQSATTPKKWMECSDVVNYDFNSVATSVIPTLKELFANPNFHALVYSGDVDAIVPFAGTMLWIESLNPTVVEPWKVWLDENKQAGGFRTVYDGFTFTTVRNAGHMVPEYQPARASQMFRSWLFNHSIF